MIYFVCKLHSQFEILEMKVFFCHGKQMLQFLSFSDALVEIKSVNFLESYFATYKNRSGCKYFSVNYYKLCTRSFNAIGLIENVINALILFCCCIHTL